MQVSFAINSQLCCGGSITLYVFLSMDSHRLRAPSICAISGGSGRAFLKSLQLLESVPLPNSRSGEFAQRGVCRPLGFQCGSPKPSGWCPSLGFSVQKVPSPRIPIRGEGNSLMKQSFFRGRIPFLGVLKCIFNHKRYLFSYQYPYPCSWAKAGLWSGFGMGQDRLISKQTFSLKIFIWRKASGFIKN